MLGEAVERYLGGSGRDGAFVVGALRAYAAARGGFVESARRIEAWETCEVGFLVQDLCTDLGHAHDAWGVDHRAFVAQALGLSEADLADRLHPGANPPGLAALDLDGACIRAAAFAISGRDVGALFCGALALCAEAGQDPRARVLDGLGGWEIERGLALAPAPGMVPGRRAEAFTLS